MKPFLFYSPHFSIPSFAFMIMMASLIATAVLYKTAPKRGLSQVVVLDLAIIGTLAGVLGARIFHILVEAPGYYWEHPTHVWQIWRGGFVSYGVFIGFAIGWITYLKVRKLDTLSYLDHLGLFGGPIVDFCVRVGCLLAGCCYGKPSIFHSGKYFLYLTFNSGDAGSKFPGVALYPTQIYSMIVSIIIFLILYFIVDKRKSFKGQVMMTFLMLYAASRFFIEFLRGDMDRGVYFNAISTGQIMSILFFFGAMGCYFYFKKRYPLKRITDNRPQTTDH